MNCRAFYVEMLWVILFKNIFWNHLKILNEANLKNKDHIFK